MQFETCGQGESILFVDITRPQGRGCSRRPRVVVGTASALWSVPTSFDDRQSAKPCNRIRKHSRRWWKLTFAFFTIQTRSRHIARIRYKPNSETPAKLRYYNQGGLRRSSARPPYPSATRQHIAETTTHRQLSHEVVDKPPSSEKDAHRNIRPLWPAGRPVDRLIART